MGLLVKSIAVNKLCKTKSILAVTTPFGFPDGLVVKNPPANAGAQETWVQSLGWEDSLEQEMATHSSIYAWKIIWTEKPSGLQSL